MGIQRLCTHGHCERVFAAYAGFLGPDGVFCSVACRDECRIDELAHSIGVAVPFAAQLGVTFEELATAVATLTQGGIDVDVLQQTAPVEEECDAKARSGFPVVVSKSLHQAAPAGASPVGVDDRVEGARHPVEIDDPKCNDGPDESHDWREIMRGYVLEPTAPAPMRGPAGDVEMAGREIVVEWCEACGMARVGDHEERPEDRMFWVVIR